MHAQHRPKARPNAQKQTVQLPGASSRGLELKVAEGFEVCETTTVLKGADPKGLQDPRALQAQTTVRTNLIVKRTWGPTPPLAELAAALTRDIVHRVPGISELEAGAFSFNDGVQGLKVVYLLRPMPMIELKQVHVVAVDAEGSTHYTLTVGVHTPEETMNRYLASIAATRVAARQE
jgi:hypothetical protein